MVSSAPPTATWKSCSTAATPYIETIDRNMLYLDQVLRSESWRMLRRNPPLFVVQPEGLDTVRLQMLGYFRKAFLKH